MESLHSDGEPSLKRTFVAYLTFGSLSSFFRKKENMFGSKILDVAIGIIFLYILISILCSAVREGLEAWLKTRAAYLEHGIRELLHDKPATGLAQSLFNHPLVFGLFSGAYKASDATKPFGNFASSENLPSYIPAKNFALALMDMAARGPKTDEANLDKRAPAVSLDNIRSNISKLDNAPVERALLTLIDSAQGDLNLAQAKIESWFDSAMEQVSGQYKRATHLILFLIALTVAVGLNINTITIADYLYRNDAERAVLVAKATEAAKKDPASTSYDEAKKEIKEMKLPIGWTAGWQGLNGESPRWSGAWFSTWSAQLFGWLLTAFAATLGAPFWFDVLNKVVALRSAVKPQEKGREDENRPPSAVTPQPQPGTSAAPPLGDENKTDGCDVAITDVTPDEDLPAAEGGVA